jgi:hypothetical protein
MIRFSAPIIKNKRLRNFIVWFLYYIKINKLKNNELNTMCFLN